MMPLPDAMTTATPRPFNIAALPSMPWKNGGGVTRELLCQPAGATLAEFDWRISIADIAQSGPFSRFAGIDRCIVLLEGDGVLLQSEQGWQHALTTPGAPFCFAGEEACHATLLGAASRDFNVMTRRDRVRARVRCIDGNASPDHGLQHDGLPGVWLVLGGQWRDADGQLWSAGHGLCWAQTDETAGARSAVLSAALSAASCAKPAVVWQPVERTARLLQVSIERVNTHAAVASPCSREPN